MALVTMCMPILPGKKEKCQGMMDKMLAPGSESRKAFTASREAAGVHERTFLQETPDGDFVILTFEGDNAKASFAKIMENMPSDFAEFAKDVHGLDANAPLPALPKLVYDSKAQRPHSCSMLSFGDDSEKLRDDILKRWNKSD